MVEDARFEDVQPEAPLRLRAEAKEDLAVISTLLQDAVTQTADISWLRKKHRFVLLVNRFRWEDREAAERQNRPYERVQSMLVVNSVLSSKSQGVDPVDKDTVLALLQVEFEPGEDGAGRVLLNFAGDGALALDVECLDVTLKDVSRPYVARSQTLPQHPEVD